MKKTAHIGWIAGLLLLSLFSCNKDQGAAKQNRVLAKVYGKELMISDLEGMFPEGTTPEDSALIINAFVQRWVRETLLLTEAERSLPKDLNVDKLVRDYRASLIKNNYEQVLVEQLLDSVVTQDELHEFYERNKEQYQLETPIIRCYFIKVPKNGQELDSLNRWWSNPTDRNLPKLERYCQKNAVAFILNDSTWHKIEDISEELPAGTITAANISSRKEFRQSDETFQYFFRLLDVKNSREIAPLAYIEEQARKYILHQRKLKLLEQKREDLYQLALRRKDVQFFTD